MMFMDGSSMESAGEWLHAAVRGGLGVNEGKGGAVNALRRWQAALL